MDVEDVSNVDQWMQLLKKQKVALQAAGKRKGEQPRDRESRTQMVNEHMFHFMRRAMMKLGADSHLTHQSWVAGAYPPSVAPLRSLKKIYLQDLCLETHHRGSYALLRVDTPPVMMTAIMVVMEDEKDEGVTLQLYQQEDGDEAHLLDEGMVQIGRVCIVKEPYFKVMSDGRYGLRVDHLGDIIWLSPDDDKIPTDWRAPYRKFEKNAEILKEEGNLAFKAGKLNDAFESYTLALNGSTTSEFAQIIKLNRSLVSIKLRCYDRALEDVGKPTADKQPSEKGFYRAALSLYNLGKFQESHQTLESLLSHYPHSSAGKREISRTTARLREQEHGKYDFEAMYTAAKETPPCLDNATFAGNVEVLVSEGRGRGLYTTKDVVPGELLLCEKAFSYSFSDNSKTSLLMNVDTNRAVVGTQAALITITVQKIFRNPSLAPTFTSLYHGDYKPVDAIEIDGMPIVDSFLADRIISLNVFGCPRTSLESHSTTHSLKPHRSDHPKSHHTCGIFIKASHINHSCYSNARRSFIGDMQIVRATRHLSAGSELFFKYAVPGPTDTHEEMQKRLKNWGFECTCAICQQSKKTKKTVLNRRLTLLKDLEIAFTSLPAVDVPKVERLLSAIEKTYSTPAADVPRLALRDPYLLLTRVFSAAKQPNKVIETAWKVFASLGFTVKFEDPRSLKSPFVIEQWGLMEDYLIETFVDLWTAYAQVGAPEVCQKAAVECARIAYRTCIGEDETFEEQYGRVAGEAMAEGKSLSELLQLVSL